MTSSMSPKEAALSYSKRGWPVFPCQGKRPLTPHGFHHASTDPKQIERWWTWWPDANIGLPTGKRSGVLILDVDFPRGGLSSLTSLSREVGRLPRTTVSRTGCGWHLFYQMPAENKNIVTTTNLGGQGAYPGLDVKANGGYVILPPSWHEAMGRVYCWLRTAPLPPCPLPLSELLCVNAQGGATSTLSNALSAPPASVSHQAGRTFIWAVAHAQEGNRNQVGFWLACRLVEAGIDEQKASSLMQAYARAVGSLGSHSYTEKEALRSLGSTRR